MPYSVISICNVALASVGAGSIRDFDKLNKRARLCEEFYPITRDYLLSKFDWPFARSFKKLQILVIPEDEQMPNMYPYAIPVDCKTPRDIYPKGSKDPWEVIGNVIFTPKENAALYYTKIEVNPTLFSDTFANLLALGMATRLAAPLSQNKKLTSDLYSQYAREQGEAWESDANIGNDYRAHDEDPNNDTFVNPELVPLIYT